MYESLTCLIPALQNGQAGEWIVDRKNDGTKEHPIQFPFVSYGDAACNLMEEMHCFAEKHPEFELNQYQTILEKKKNEQGCDSVWTSISWTGKLSRRFCLALRVRSVLARERCCIFVRTEAL